MADIPGHTNPNTQFKVNGGARLCLLFGKHFTLSLPLSEKGTPVVIDIEIQNETHQTNERFKFAVVPRIGEGVRLQGPNGFWASYDVLDLWYQKADYGDVWVPFLHVRKTEGEEELSGSPLAVKEHGEVVPFTI